jgi:lipopolysaccharide export system protein LptC
MLSYVFSGSKYLPDSWSRSMRLSTVIFVVLLALAIGAGVYWYLAEGADLFEQIRQADNKPFLFK